MSFQKLLKKARENPTEFNVWISLLDLVEKQQNIDHARIAFDGFFQRFPYCYGYWKKLADMERHKGNKIESLEVYKRGVKAVPLSVDLWIAYADAATEFYHGHEDYEIQMRSLYEEALDVAGLEFRSDSLWEHYISWETGHNRLANATAIYTRLLAIPTQLYFQNWDSFNKMVEENRPEDILNEAEFSHFLAQVSLSTTKAIAFKEQPPDLEDDLEPPIVGSTKPVITDAIRAAIRQLIIESREAIYRSTYTQIMNRWYFEEKIRRPYFHVKPLEEIQLNNWAEYLSFEESEVNNVASQVRADLQSRGQYSDEDLDKAVGASLHVQLAKRRVRVLYERCLIACALYEHFWIRYAKYLEYVEKDIPGARQVWRRACNIHLAYKPTIHWHWGLFEDRYPANLDDPPTEPVITSLEILTSLEERLTDSALVCCRRADALRRAGKPLFEIIACLRSGVNRLRYLVEEQNKVAKCVSGATASRTVAQAIATAAQARAGAGVLSGRMARLLHRDELLCANGIPTWMLLLNTIYKDPDEEENQIIRDLPMKAEDDEQEVQAEQNGEIGQDKSETNQDESQSAPTKEIEENGTDDSETKDDQKDEEVKTKEEQSDDSADSMAEDSDNEDDDSGGDDDDGEDDEGGDDDDDDEMKADSDIEQDSTEQMVDGNDSPPAIPTKKSSTNKAGRKRKADRKSKRSKAKRQKTSDEDEVKELSEAERAKAEAERAAEEEERIRQMLDKRHKLVRIRLPPQSSLTEEDRQIITGEQAAIKVLKEAIDYDPRNERLYAQLLDIAYQRRPIDIDGFIEIANLATIDSVLPAHIKLAFCQRKLQFLEEFDSDLSRLNATYEEYLGLCEAINNGVTTSALAHGASRLIPGYPLPDLLNLPTVSLRVSSCLTANPCETLVSAAPVARQPCLTTDQSALEAAAAVGTPAPEPSTAAGYYTAGAYEPLASALGNTTGLPPLVPTSIPVAMLPGMPDPASGVAVSASWTGTSDAYATYYYGTAGAGAAVIAPVAVPVATPIVSSSTAPKSSVNA